MSPWPIFAELEACLLACMVLYLNLLALSAYGGLAHSRRRMATGRAAPGGEDGPGMVQSGRPAAAVMFGIGLAAVLVLMARLIWLLV